MLISRWIIAGAFGLAASLGQAQEQASEAQGQSQAHKAPTRDTHFAIPVDIIEDEAEAEARQRSQEEARKREIRDLSAQEGMNTATQSIERATRDMRDYALYSTIAVWIGTALLLYTLWLTRQANRAAQSAVAVTRVIGKIQTEANLSVVSFDLFSLSSFGHAIYAEQVTSGSADIGISVSNKGNSPAVIQSATLKAEVFVKKEMVHSLGLPTEVERHIIEAAGPGLIRSKIPNRILIKDGFQPLTGATINLHMSVEYTTRFMDRDILTYEYETEIVPTKPVKPEINITLRDIPDKQPRVSLTRLERGPDEYEKA